MTSPTRPDDERRDGEIHLWRTQDVWIAKDVESGIASQGPSREAALQMVDDAVALHNGERGRQVTDEFLKEMGIDPDLVSDEPEVPSAPWFDSDA